MWLRYFLVILIVLLIDWYFFQAIKTVSQNMPETKRSIINITYWGFTVFTLSFVFFYNVLPSVGSMKFIKLYAVSVILIVMFCKLIGIIPVLIDDIIRLVKLAVQFIAPASVVSDSNGISRAKFLNQLAVIIAAIPFAAFAYGMVKGAFDFQLKTIKLKLPNLPEGLKGLKILQISDLHIGSFVSGKPLQTAIDIINEQKADIIFFTGDLVNNLAAEAEEFLDLLKKIKAPLGVFSILGNHDYGHYMGWDSEAKRLINLERLKEIHKEVGWRLLLNENCVLEKNGNKLAIIGVENWSAVMRFPKYGNLNRAAAGTKDIPVKLLLSHDPSHWGAEVVKTFRDIDITFSGHTHGLQFGVEIPGFKWSPVQYFYKQWAGLYQEGNQYLYVNRGLGFIGYMGRVGILPEITLFELHN